MTLVLLLVAVAFLAVGVAVRRNEQRRRREAARTVDLAVDAIGVRRRLADGRTEAIDWDEIREVEVVTTAVGVHRDDGVLLVLYGDERRGCLVPSRVAADTDLLGRLAGLPGFDAHALVRAMAQDPPSQTVVWSVGPG